MQTKEYLAIDLGASSGRVMLGQWDGERFALHELHRFANGPVSIHGRLYWDVLRLWQETIAGMARYGAAGSGAVAPGAGAGAGPGSIGIDGWGVDFALLDSAGKLLGNPFHYRDARTAGMPERVDVCVPREAVYKETGIQRMSINTLYQLFSMRVSDDPTLRVAETLLLIPDLFHYWLTGRKVAEYTNATTTQMLSARERRWATGLLEALQLPSGILPETVEPGTLLGEMLPDVSAQAGLRRGLPVIATASHDTASAVAAVPRLDRHSAYISSGTWSLVGVELDEPILSEEARRLNFTNEGGVGGTVRFLKNVTGLWVLEECRRQWQREGKAFTWPDLVRLAEDAPPLRSLVDPDSGDFSSPGDMPAAIRKYCRRTGQPEPTGVGELVRCCLESLALKYRWAVSTLETLTGRTLDTIRMVGGGSQNRLACQLTADACARRVVAGPAEATALGNILVQAVTLGDLPSIAAGREAVASSVQQAVFAPRGEAGWDAAWSRFETLMTGNGS